MRAFARPHAHPHLAPDQLSLRGAGERRDPDAAADPAQSRRPICRRLAHRRVGRLPARPARGCLRQHHPRFTAEGPFGELAVLVEGEVETRDTQGIVRGAVERFPPSLYLRETALTSADAGHRRALPRRRDAAGGDALALLHAARSAARGHGLRYRPDRTPPRPRRKLSRCKRGVCQDFAHIFIAGRAQPRHSRRAMSAAISTATTAWPSRRPATPGPKPSSPGSAGSPSIRQRHLRDRRPCPRRGRARLSRRGAGARHPLWRRRRGARDASRSHVDQASQQIAELTRIAQLP